MILTVCILRKRFKKTCKNYTKIYYIKNHLSLSAIWIRSKWALHWQKTESISFTLICNSLIIKEDNIPSFKSAIRSRKYFSLSCENHNFVNHIWVRHTDIPQKNLYHQWYTYKCKPVKFWVSSELIFMEMNVS